MGKTVNKEQLELLWADYLRKELPAGGNNLKKSILTAFRSIAETLRKGANPYHAAGEIDAICNFSESNLLGIDEVAFLEEIAFKILRYGILCNMSRLLGVNLKMSEQKSGEN